MRDYIFVHFIASCVFLGLVLFVMAVDASRHGTGIKGKNVVQTLVAIFWGVWAAMLLWGGWA